MCRHTTYILYSHVQFARQNIKYIYRQSMDPIVQSTFWINYNNVISTANLYQNYYKSHSSRPIHTDTTRPIGIWTLHIRFKITCIVCVPRTRDIPLCVFLSICVDCMQWLYTQTTHSSHLYQTRRPIQTRWKQNSEKKIYPNARTLRL